jgi:hypothetical protein
MPSLAEKSHQVRESVFADRFFVAISWQKNNVAMLIPIH